MGQTQTETNLDALDLGTLLVRLAAELQDSATHLTALQWSISTLLETVHHPDLAEEIHMLQDIDRLQQTLADVASLIDVAAMLPQPVTLPRDPLCNAIRLESLRTRLDLGRPADALATPGTVRGRDAGEDITWL